MQQFKKDVSKLGNIVEHMETRMGDYANTVNELIDAQEAQSDEQIWIKDKIADIEVRSRWNNVKIRGISEEIQDLSTYVRNLIKTLIPGPPASQDPFSMQAAPSYYHPQPQRIHPILINGHYGPSVKTLPTPV